MAFNEHTFLADVSKQTITPPNPHIIIGQGEHNAYTLRAVLFDNNKPLALDDYDVWFEMLLPDKRTSYAQIAESTDGNVATIVIDEQKAGAVVGFTKTACITIKSGETFVAQTGRFGVEVLRSPMGGQPAESWVSGIDETIAAMESATDGANQAATAAAEATEAAESATETAQQAASDIAAQVEQQQAAFEASEAARASTFAASEQTRVSEFSAAQAARQADYEQAESAREAQSSQATQAATDAASAANSAAVNATSAAGEASTQAAAAQQSAQAASSAATSATEAAESADDAASTASTAAAQATEAKEAIEELIEEGLQVPLMTSSTRGGAKLGWGLEVVNGALQVSPGVQLPKKDATTGLYDNASVKNWLDSMRENKVYTVAIPKYDYSDTTTCEKRDANAGLVVTPSTAEVAGSNDYASHLCFMRWDVNGGTGDDGTPFMSAVRDWDSAFSLYGDNGNVFELTPVYWWALDEDSDPNYKLLKFCDTERDGFEPRPGAVLPDGTLRPYMLHSKYPGVLYDGKLASVSGQKLLNRSVSHNSAITLAHAVGSGYSCFSFADLWYLQSMMLMKYAVKSSQAIYSGCVGYTAQVHPTVAETSVKRVILSNANADALVVGSRMMLGNQATASTDRNSINCYNVFDALEITSIDVYDSSNKAVYFDTDAVFDTDTTYLLSTSPYGSGFLDSVMGCDGTVSAAGRTNSKEPFLLQGIECMLGAYEIVGDVILNAHEIDSELLIDVNVNYDSLNESTSLTADYVDVGVSLPTSATVGWLYQKDIANAGGLLVGVGSPSASNRGTGDAIYQNVATSKGLREFLAFGYLGYGSAGGLFCVGSGNVLGLAGWNLAPRLSTTGRTKAPSGA